MRLEPQLPRAALAAVRTPFEAAGAERADAPLVQPLGLLLDLAGEAMRARLFVVQAEGAGESCLRPDFTVAIARQHLESGRAAGRYFYEGKAFRAAPGDGEPEEFLQLGLERFEPAEDGRIAADAEVTALAWQAATAGGRTDLELWLGDVGLFSAFVDGLELAPGLATRLRRAAGRPRLLQRELGRAGEAPGAAEGGRLAAILAGLSSDDAAALLEEVWALAGVERVGGRGPAEIAQRLVRRAEAAAAPALRESQAEAIRRFLAVSAPPEAALDEIRMIAESVGADLGRLLAGWRERLARLAAAGAGGRLRFATALGHDFDYYDGLTFEIRSAALGESRPVAVGGRYDSLLARLGGPGDVGAVGCMVRPGRAIAEGLA